MIRNQRAHYFRDLWPAACAAQGWERRDEARRRAVTMEATGKDSSTHLSEMDVSALFDHLKHLADPLSLAKAMLAANPELGAEAHDRRQLLFVIDRFGFADAYVARCAEGLRRKCGASGWREMDANHLQKLRFTLTIRARQRDAKAGKRAPYEPRAVPYEKRAEAKAKRAAAREPVIVPRFGVLDGGSLFPF